MENSETFHRHLGVYGICTVNDSILVIRKILGPYTGKFDLPGGRLEESEALEQGIGREFQEETGYTLQKLKNIGACDFSVKWNLNKYTIETLHHIAIMYEVEVDYGESTRSIHSFEGQDSMGAIWLSLTKITPENSSPLVLQATEWLRTGLFPFQAGSFDFTTK